jgi:hypothetical protein
MKAATGRLEAFDCRKRRWASLGNQIDGSWDMGSVYYRHLASEALDSGHSETDTEERGLQFRPQSPLRQQEIGINAVSAHTATLWRCARIYASRSIYQHQVELSSP